MIHLFLTVSILFQAVSTERFEDYLRAHKREHELIAEAQKAAKVADDLRIDRLNELRQEVQQDRGQFQTVVAAELIRQRSEEARADIQKDISEIKQEIAAMRSQYVYTVAGVVLLFAAIQLFLRFGKKEP